MAVLAVTGVLLWLLSDVVLLVFMAALIAVILRGAAHRLTRATGVCDSVTLAFVCVITAALSIGFLYYIGPKLALESVSLWTQLHQQWDNLRQTYGNTPWGHEILQHAAPGEAIQGHVVSYASSVASTTLGGLISGFVLLVTALYFAIAPDVYVRGLVLLFPLPWRPLTRHVLRQVGSTLRWWSLGQLIDMVVVGVIVGVGLTLLNVPLALALAVLAGLLTFVPYFGAIAAAVPALLVALTVSAQTALWVLMVFAVSHAVDGYIVSPLVQRRTVHLPPALSILSMTVLGTLFGPLGIVLGTPFAAAALVVVREAYVGGVLRDPALLRD